ncbi:MAG: gamma-glutamyltransferase [Defluviitaleaceae bacterium]|nr:gamma-glutamyltransferase [Defluviitaleaceae bacterium]
MNFNFNNYAYPSSRTVVFGQKGMTATGNPLAAQAGLDMLKKGGNAIDAIVAMAMCLPVVEPTANGIGGDAFAIMHINGKLYGLNASGYSPKGISAKILRDKGINEIDPYGIESVTVPGAPSAWAALMERFGKLPFTTVAGPAIQYAKEGFPVSVHVANGWGKMSTALQKKNMDIHKGWFKTFSKNSEIPKTGDIYSYDYMGDTLEEIARTGGKSFYEGNLMEKIVEHCKRSGGYFEASDFTEHKPEWVEPISFNYKGYDVIELPPNGSGVVALMALNIFKNFELDSVRESARNYHLMIESMKLAYADAHKYIADPRFMDVTCAELLSSAYGKKRASEIDLNKAKIFSYGIPKGSGTVYLCAADGEGNMVSYIQSNYTGFGSGIVVDGTDIALQNRGHNFTMEEGHVNELGSKKRPYHTIIPGFLMKDGRPIDPFGVMGGFMQPQGHLQMIVNTIDFNMNPQESLDATRFQWLKANTVQIERTINEGIVARLAEMGHNIDMGFNQFMGRGQIIWRLENGVLCGGTEPRTDGTVVSW